MGFIVKIYQTIEKTRGYKILIASISYVCGCLLPSSEMMTNSMRRAANFRTGGAYIARRNRKIKAEKPGRSKQRPYEVKGVKIGRNGEERQENGEARSKSPHVNATCGAPGLFSSSELMTNSMRRPANFRTGGAYIARRNRKIKAEKPGRSKQRPYEVKGVKIGRNGEGKEDNGEARSKSPHVNATCGAPGLPVICLVAHAWLQSGLEARA